MQHYYLGQWVWNNQETRWEIPQEELSTGAIDLRSIAHCSIAGGSPQGHAIFTYSSPVSVPSFIYLGFSKDGVISNEKRKDVFDITGKNIKANNIKDLILEFLTDHADHTGKSFCKPLMPNHKLILEIDLGKENKIHQENFSTDHPHYKKVKDCLQHSYNEMIDSIPHDSVAKWMDATSSKFGIDYKELIPLNAKIRLVPLPHQTVITESFNKADAATLGPDLTWGKITGDHRVASNQMTVNSGGGAPGSNDRAETDFSSADMYAQISVTSIGAAGVSRQICVGCRFNSSATSAANMNWYSAGYNGFSNPSRRIRIEKCINGTVTSLFGPDTSTSISLPDLLYLSVSGSSLTAKVAGTTILSGTDTSITQGLRAGVVNGSMSTTKPTADSFEAGDFTASSSSSSSSCSSSSSSRSSSSSSWSSSSSSSCRSSSSSSCSSSSSSRSSSSSSSSSCRSSSSSSSSLSSSCSSSSSCRSSSSSSSSSLSSSSSSCRSSSSSSSRSSSSSSSSFSSSCSSSSSSRSSSSCSSSSRSSSSCSSSSSSLSSSCSSCSSCSSSSSHSFKHWNHRTDNENNFTDRETQSTSWKNELDGTIAESTP